MKIEVTTTVKVTQRANGPGVTISRTTTHDTLDSSPEHERREVQRAVNVNRVHFQNTYQLHRTTPL